VALRQYSSRQGKDMIHSFPTVQVMSTLWCISQVSRRSLAHYRPVLTVRHLLMCCAPFHIRGA
jgi:hypothetical protein